MKLKIANRFLINYILILIISIIITFFGLLLLDFSNHVLSNTLVKNNYTAKDLMQDDYNSIDTTPVIENGGGVQVINKDFEVVFSEGLSTFTKNKLTTSEFTEFLVMSNSKGIPYSYGIEYNSKEQFWLIVIFPTSLRIDLAIVHNKDYASVDMNSVVGVVLSIVLFCLLLLAIITVIYSKITSIGIVNPLKKLHYSALLMRDGDYSARVEIDQKNELGDLQEIFNSMAEQIEQEIYLRKQSEENRKQLVLDISHDLKNPLASIMGYAELCYDKPNLTKEESNTYMKIIYENSVRANNLITDLFELSKLESSEYTINRTRVDICEYVREKIASFIAIFDKNGFIYEFNIPEKEIFIGIDIKQFDRVFQNLVDNTLQYNQQGTKVDISLIEQKSNVMIVFKDNGIGIPIEITKDIFQPFVRGDSSRNSQTGGTGLGLAITEKIIAAHGGSIDLKSAKNCGCEFTISIPKI